MQRGTPRCDIRSSSAELSEAAEVFRKLLRFIGRLIFLGTDVAGRL